MSVVIGGVEPFTTVDFPGRLAAVFFCLGCTWRCPYCHNPELQPFSGMPVVEWDKIVEFLESRKKLLDGIVFSGGEPLWQDGLTDAMKQVKAMGFDVGLHTAGADAARLEKVLPLVDWIGFDIKVPFEFYDRRIPNAKGEEALKSLRAILKSGVEFEARTTLDPRLISVSELRELAHMIADAGVKTYALQEYRPHPTHETPPSAEDISAFFRDKALLSELNDLFSNFIVRRA